MDDKILELERVFNRIMNVPKRIKQKPFLSQENLLESDNSNTKSKTLEDQKTILVEQRALATADHKKEVNCELVEKYNHLMNENVSLLQNLKLATSKLREFEEKEKLYDLNLNQINYTLKKNEKLLKNTILKCRGAIRVICRIKPSQSKSELKYNDTNIFIGDKSFGLNYIFDQKTTQLDVMNEFQPEIESIFDGYNVCIFAYGQTGSGKTFTMEGNESNKGLVFNAFDYINQMASSLIEDEYSISYSIKHIEIYNENIKDLIKGNIVSIIHDHNGVELKNCHEVVTSNIKDAESIIKCANLKRATGATDINAKSSRSHLIFMLKINITKMSEVREGSLVLIDLAGSERLSKSKAENERLKETQYINKSLSALGNVITAIKRNDTHIPFRDSKLTHIMQDALSKNSRTSMIVNIDPENIEETICSLRFAIKVSECELGLASRNIRKII